MYQAQYGTYQQPRKKRGLKRMIFGGLGIIANGIGLVVMPLVAGVAVALVATLTATPVSLGGTSVSFDASASSLHYLYVPASDAAAASCMVEGESEVLWEPQADATVPATLDGVEYSPIGTITVTSDQQVTITCDGAQDVAVSDVGMLGVGLGAIVGFVLPVVLGVLSLALLIWGIVARVRS